MRMTSAPKLESSFPQYPPMRLVKSKILNPVSAPADSVDSDGSGIGLGILPIHRCLTPGKYIFRQLSQTRDGSHLHLP